jgi:adenosyl cobinamide kinase/adenosyl cobinamide phosphate guanylyltransferase
MTNNRKTIFITGGSRSGKSRHAMELSRAIAGKRVFIATAQGLDAEMEDRIGRHRSEREATGSWITVEEPLEVAEAIRKHADSAVIVLDCVTLWVTNLLLSGEPLSEDDISSRARELSRAAGETVGTVIIVTNETGMGIVPDNELSRRFSDLAGRANQVIAAAADEVIFMVSGYPLCLKKPG